MRALAAVLATYCAGWIPAMSDAGWTVTVVLPATTWPLWSVTAAESVKSCGPSAVCSVAGIPKAAVPFGPVVVVPFARSASRAMDCFVQSQSVNE